MRWLEMTKRINEQRIGAGKAICKFLSSILCRITLNIWLAYWTLPKLISETIFEDAKFGKMLNQTYKPLERSLLVDHLIYLSNWPLHVFAFINKPLTSPNLLPHSNIKLLFIQVTCWGLAEAGHTVFWNSNSTILSHSTTRNALSFMNLTISNALTPVLTQPPRLMAT